MCQFWNVLATYPSAYAAVAAGFISELTADSFVMGCKWVYKLKYKDVIFDKRKSRLVALGYQ